MAKSKAQKALASGPSRIGAKARAAASALRGAGAVKAPETRHLQSQQFGSNGGRNREPVGRHAAPRNMTSVTKNNKGTDYIGKRRSGNSSDRGPVVHV
jgi:hypothetical protein